ncbi:MAG: dihydrolipoyllysine-residue acetyltransferase [Wenzhouxiangellaceae bacterium]|nr:MAG: dihydrolipoyllysine-residue acetyltransferase [Wenzhouxiangellaceae bacterium]
MSDKREIRVPDIGDFDKVPVIEVLVAEGDEIEAEQSLVTLESDKATMEVPASAAGKLVELRVKEGDEVGEGDVIAIVEAADGGEEEKEEGRGKGASEDKDDAKDEQSDDSEDSTPESGNRKPETASSESGIRKPEADPSDPHQSVPGWEDGLPPPPVPFDEMDHDPGSLPHASPSVRKLARELGVDLKGVEGSGRKGRITEEDLKSHVKQVMEAPPAAPAAGSGLAVAEAPKIDFSKYGEIEEEKLSRIKRISGPNLHRNWVSIPHVTQFDQADITEMEVFRKSSQRQAEAAGTKMTPLVFLIKAVVAALKEFPHFNASLSNDGQTLIRKKYFHVGVAVDTPNGLVVPVLRDCDQKGLIELAKELTDLSGRAREGKLKGDEMKGGCLSISSLGGIGGTAFTPIINAPELAILGVSRAEMKPVWDGSAFQPRLMMPLSLSYDHRVIDGADAARFTRFLAEQLEDLRRLLL